MEECLFYTQKIGVRVPYCPIIKKMKINDLLSEFNILLVLILFSFIIGIILFLISFKGILKKIELNKNSIYECGFEPFNDVRSEFDVRFYLVGLLFIIFDLEIIFLFPWIMVLGMLDIYGLLSMILFLIILIVIFIYEWRLGVLDW